MPAALPDFPRFPPTGDAHETHTWAGMGAVIDRWKLVEFEHSRLFAALMDDIAGNKLLTFYGAKGGIFRDRFKLLKIAADHRFVIRPDQDHEGEFDRLSDVTMRFADCRNDVAHSIVFDLTNAVGWLGSSSHKANFFAVPPVYAWVKRDRRGDGTLPYAYGSAELNALASATQQLAREWRALRHTLFPDAWPLEPREP